MANTRKLDAEFKKPSKPSQKRKLDATIDNTSSASETSSEGITTRSKKRQRKETTSATPNISQLGHFANAKKPTQQASNYEEQIADLQNQLNQEKEKNHNLTVMYDTLFARNQVLEKAMKSLPQKTSSTDTLPPGFWNQPAPAPRPLVMPSIAETQLLESKQGEIKQVAIAVPKPIRPSKL